MNNPQPRGPAQPEPAGAGQQPAMPEVSAVILAGGRSRRLGVDKALLKLDGEWVLARIANALASLSDDLLAVIDDQDKVGHPGLRTVADMLRGLGPLGGIYSGLRAMRHEHGLFVACDMPLLDLNLLRYMVSLSINFDVVIPRIGDNVEPLHAVYSKACTTPVADLLERGDLRIVHFFPRVRVRYVEQAEIDAFDPQHWSFFNINTAHDLKRARQLILGQDGTRWRRQG
jgi:molybdopterin-guanine dinucleotide biosynthesis protein A